MSNSAPQGNSSSNRIPAVLLFLVAIGVPSAAGLAFAHTITQNPWFALGLGILYELAIVVVATVGKVWQKLESPLVDHIAKWVKFGIQGIFSRYQRNYFQHLIYEHQVFDVKGLNTRTAYDLELEPIFVQLDVHTTPVHKASANPLKIPEKLSEGEHDIWDYLASPAFVGQQFVVIGPPGSGKTTLLKHMALALAQPRRFHHIHTRLKLPLFLYLRDHASMIKDNPDCSLTDLIQKHIQKKWQQVMPAQWLERYLKKREGLILLDGLDEVADPETRKQIVEWVQRQMLAFINNRFILTSRPYGYRDNPLDGVTILEVRPFTPRQINQFVRKWYIANELKSWGKDDAGMRMRAHEGAEDLLNKFYQAPVLLELAVNPLLLTMIATVHRTRGVLPGKRVELYREICDVFLGGRREAIGITQELRPAQKQAVLQPLAYHLMQQGILEIKLDKACKVIKPHLTRVSTTIQPEAFIKVVEDTSGLFLEQNPGIYGFAHKTFQEYLAALYIKEKGLEQELINQVSNSWWHETIRLYCAQADATEIIKACLNNNNPSDITLKLALECNEEKLEASDSVIVQINQLLEKGVDDSDLERRRIISEALLQRRLQQMVYLQDDVYTDTSMVTCAEYQLFIDDDHVSGYSHVPDHWKSDVFLPTHGHLPILGVQPEDAVAFCRWLTYRDTGAWLYRLPNVDEQQKIQTKLKDVMKAQDDIGYWTDDGKKFAWLNGTVPEYNNLHSMIQDILNQDRQLARTFDRVRASGRNEFIDLALNLENKLDRADIQSFDFDETKAPILARALNLQDVFTRATELDSLLDNANKSELEDTLSIHINYVDKCRSAGAASSNDEQLRRWYVRYLTQLLARYTHSLIRKQPTPPGRWKRVGQHHYFEGDYVLEKVFKGYLDIYATLALLELRIEAKLPVWEGILLVKERRHEGMS